MRPQAEINTEIELHRPEREARVRKIEDTFAVCEEVAKREMEASTSMTNQTIQIAKAICDHERGIGQWDTMIAVLTANKKKRPGDAEARFLATANAVLGVIPQPPDPGGVR